MSKKTKGLIVYIGVIVFGVIVGILSYSVFQTETEPTPAPDLEQYLIKTPNTLRSKWDRRIETKQTTAGIEVINNYDAYKITVPESAEVPLIADGSQGLQIYYEHTVENTNEGPVLLLDILPLNNSQNHSLSKWALLNPAANRALENINFKQTNINSYTTLISSTPLYKEVILNTGVVKRPIPDTEKLIYILNGKNNKVYKITCKALGAKNILIPLCDAWVKTFNTL